VPPTPFWFGTPGATGFLHGKSLASGRAGSQVSYAPGTRPLGWAGA
jgi:hypothetical protein